MAPSNEKKYCYKFGRFRLYPSERRLLCDGKDIHLQPKQFDCLAELVANSGKLVKKDELMGWVWPQVFVEEGTLVHHISALKKILSKAADGYKCIETVSKSGYRFIGAVEAIDRDDDRALPADALSAPHSAVEDALQDIKPEETQVFPAKAPDAATLPLSSASSQPAPLPAQIKDSTANSEPCTGEATTLERKSNDPPPAQTNGSYQQPAPPTGAGLTPQGMESVEVAGKNGDEEPLQEPQATTPLPVPSGQGRNGESTSQTQAADLLLASQALEAANQSEASGEIPADEVIDNSAAAPVTAVKAAPITDVLEVLIAVMIIGIILAELSKYLISSTYLERYATLAQFLVIFGAFISTRRVPKSLDAIISKEAEAKIRKASGYEKESDWDDAKQMAVMGLKDYKKYWYGLLISWGLLYIALVFLPTDAPAVASQHLARLAVSSADVLPRLVATLLNNCNSLMLALGYLILNQSTIGNDGGQIISRVPWAIGGIIVAVFTLGEASTLLSFHHGFHFINRFISSVNIPEIADWLSGIAGSIALALYVGRLQSKFLSPPHWLVVIALYGYAAIQPLYAFIGKDEVAAVIIKYAALILKGLLCICIVRLFQSGQLLFYFVRVRRTYEKVDREWIDFQKLLK